MQYSDYDLLLKYQLSQERLKSVYFGNPSIYTDGRTLEIFPEYNDKVNGTTPLFVFGTVVFLRYKDSFLILDQKKEDKVVDTLVGLGGKIKPVLKCIVPEKEKNNINDILEAYENGYLDVEEEIKAAAVREVMEETSDYSIGDNGEFTHEIIKSGIKINPSLLKTIGISRIRIIKPNKTECWLISNFIYNLNDEEYIFIENNVNKRNREGNLQWMSLEEALPYMSNSDKIILASWDKSVSVSEIRDYINGQNVVRVEIKCDNDKVCATIINGTIVNSKGDTRYLANFIQGQIMRGL